jgi:hypothetical protein
VLQRLGGHIANALERAAQADQRAADATDWQLRQTSENWRVLARSFQFVESLEQLLIEAQRRRKYCRWSLRMILALGLLGWPPVLPA